LCSSYNGHAREIKKKNPKKHVKLQTIFKGNNTTMRNHIARMGMSDELGHYNTYWEKCMEGEIEMQAHCIPDEEPKHLQCEVGVSDNSERYIIISFIVFMTKIDYHDV
jgi:hypothetical protein